MRDTTFSIFKALAIFLVVVAHAVAPTYLARFAYLINVPVFFVLSGYFFRVSNVEQKTDFLLRRTRRLYLPFLKWSVFFLLIHNLLFPLGLLSEQYGNAAGGVTHPYTAHEMAQNLWSMVFNMSGYDPFLAGSFWFFRALWVSSVAFLILFFLLSKLRWLTTPTQQAGVIASLALLLGVWHTQDGLCITGLAQGGYRELMGVFFLAVGFLLRRLEEVPAAKPYLHPVVGILGGGTILTLLTLFYPVSMSPRATNVGSVVALSLSGTAGFFLLRNVAVYLNRLPAQVQRVLVYVGDNSIYIFGFHLLAFKLVSALKVGVYALPWSMVGGHPVVQTATDDAFWMLYAIVGVALPLLWVWGWQRLCVRYRFKTETPADWLRIAVRLTILAFRGLQWFGLAVCAGVCRLGRMIWGWVLWVVDTTKDAIYGEDD